MKRFLSFFISFLVVMSAWAQSPTCFNWQGIIRDGAGKALENKPVALELLLLQDTASDGKGEGPVIYFESHNAVTNQFGLVNVQVGCGKPVFGRFSDLDWGTRKYWLSIRANVDGKGLVDIGKSPILPVPLSVYTKIAAFDGSDLNLGLNDGRPIGSRPSQRALVHDINDVLIINYDGDFEGGVRIQSSTNIDGSLNIGGDLNVGSWENHQITLQNARKFIKIPKDPDGRVIFTVHSYQENPSWEYRDLLNDKLIFRISAIDNPTVDINGRTRTKILEIIGGSDLTEGFDIHPLPNATPEPGMLLSIDPANPGKLMVSAEPYDKKLAGVISGANGIEPGMRMGQQGTIADGNYPVTLTGRVYVKADAAFGAIQPGDLLTSSSVPGFAMRVTDYAQAHGAVIGKAMTGLAEGQGFVLVLVALQ